MRPSSFIEPAESRMVWMNCPGNNQRLHLLVLSPLSRLLTSFSPLTPSRNHWVKCFQSFKKKKKTLNFKVSCSYDLSSLSQDMQISHKSCPLFSPFLTFDSLPSSLRFGSCHQPATHISQCKEPCPTHLGWDGQWPSIFSLDLDDNLLRKERALRKRKIKGVMSQLKTLIVSGIGFDVLPVLMNLTNQTSTLSHW